jgi:hypothetical protein
MTANCVGIQQLRQRQLAVFNTEHMSLWVGFSTPTFAPNRFSMPNAFFQVPYPENEPVLEYGPNSPEREAQLAEYERMFNQAPVQVPMVIGGRKVLTEDKRPLSPPTIINT